MPVERLPSVFGSPRWRRVGKGALLLLATAAGGALLYSWYAPREETFPPDRMAYREERLAGNEPIVPVPIAIELDARKVALGKRLFHDARLSADNTVSCSTCHGLEHGGADHTPHSFGVGGKEGVINAPTVYNSGFNFRQFWDGRAATLEEQIDGPINNPLEMASSWPQVLRKLREDDGYRKAFGAIYPDAIEAGNVKDAIATFERSLYTPNSRFDRYLRGDKAALNSDELAGYRLFKSIGCASCHQGVNVGGNLYEKMGVMQDYFGARGRVSDADLGRFVHTGVEEQRFEFKVPSLRNVALTAPYFHDGSAWTLDEAVRLMARHQIGMELDEVELRQIVAFLQTLTGEYQGAMLK